MSKSKKYRHKWRETKLKNFVRNSVSRKPAEHIKKLGKALFCHLFFQVNERRKDREKTGQDEEGRKTQKK